MASVRLRDWQAGDAPAIAPMLSDPHLLKWSSLPTIGAQRWIEEQQAARRGPSLAICEAGDDRPLGKVALRMPGRASGATTCAAIRDSDHPLGELSYWVLPEARGRGLASAGASAMLDRVRQSGELQSVVMDIEIDNYASMQIAARQGAERREPERVAVDRNGTARTMIVFVVAL